MEQLDLKFVDQTLERIGSQPRHVLAILQALQGHYGYLPQQALERLCQLTNITPASVMGVSTFYNQFRHRPVGRHIIHVCVGTACHVKGADQIYEAFRRHLNIPPADDTDPNRIFTVEKIFCLGCCTLAPAAQIGKVTYGHLTPDTVPNVVNDFLNYEGSRAVEKRKARMHHAPGRDRRGEIRIGLDSCCVARGSGKLRDALVRALDETGRRQTGRLRRHVSPDTSA